MPNSWSGRERSASTKPFSPLRHDPHGDPSENKKRQAHERSGKRCGPVWRCADKRQCGRYRTRTNLKFSGESRTPGARVCTFVCSRGNPSFCAGIWPNRSMGDVSRGCPPTPRIPAPRCPRRPQCSVRRPVAAAMIGIPSPPAPHRRLVYPRGSGLISHFLTFSGEKNARFAAGMALSTSPQMPGPDSPRRGGPIP
jgi:hypothetical protein